MKDIDAVYVIVSSDHSVKAMFPVHCNKRIAVFIQKQKSHIAIDYFFALRFRTVTTDYLIYGITPYKENAKINTMISVVPKKKRKQVEKLIALFLTALQTDEEDSK